MEKSFNIVATELLELVKSGYGIHQAMREVGINNSELLVCLNRNEELAAAVKSRFGITPDGTGIKTGAAENELAELRARAEKLGLKVHSQAGIKKIKQMIADAEDELKNQPPAPAPNAQPDTGTTPKPAGNQGLDNENPDGTGIKTGAAENESAAPDAAAA